MANFVLAANAAKRRKAKSFKFKLKNGKTRMYHAHTVNRNGGTITVWKAK